MVTLFKLLFEWVTHYAHYYNKNIVNFRQKNKDFKSLAFQKFTNCRTSGSINLLKRLMALF